MEEIAIPIRWRDVDAYGHVNNAVYLTYLEECRDRWVRATLGPAFDHVIVRIAIDYRREVSLDDHEVTVRCRGVGFGTSSIRTAEEILVGGRIVAAESESVVVARAADAGRSRPLTAEERATLGASIARDAERPAT